MSYEAIAATAIRALRAASQDQSLMFSQRVAAMVSIRKIEEAQEVLKDFSMPKKRKGKGGKKCISPAPRIESVTSWEELWSEFTKVVTASRARGQMLAMG